MPRRAPWLTRNVVSLGLVSLLTDTASEMVVPLLPAFLTVVLGAGPIALGFIEGVADATSSVLKLVSGRWADRLRRYRPLVLAGYTLSSLVRPLMALAGSPGHVLAVRAIDRTGKGLRSSPRDALLAASADPEHGGAVFGFHRAMDHAGAVLGPLLALAFLAWRPGELRLLFAATLVPGVLVLVALVLGVREPARPELPPPREVPPPPWLAAPAPALRPLLAALAVFTLGNASDVFLLLKASEGEGSRLTTLPLLWVGLHMVKSVSSLLGGRLADRWGRRSTIALGWLVYTAVYAALAFADSRALVWTLFLVYGLYHGLSEGPEKALVAELAGPGGRGSAFGWYHLTVGTLALPASVLFGWIWEAQGSRAAFLTAASLAVAGLALLRRVGTTPRLATAAGASRSGSPGTPPRSRP